jgi:hypothetical protein
MLRVAAAEMDNMERLHNVYGWELQDADDADIDLRDSVHAFLAKAVRLSDGGIAHFVAVYAVDRAYGGPEEGGWWYDTGQRIHLEVVTTEERAIRRREELRELYPVTGNRGSVLGSGYYPDGDYEVVTSYGIVPVESFPETRPRYE